MVLGLYSMCTLRINAVLIISQVPKQHCEHGALRIVFVLLRCISTCCLGFQATEHGRRKYHYSKNQVYVISSATVIFGSFLFHTPH